MIKEQKFMKNYELIKFRDNEFELDVNVSPEEDTVWLTKDEIALLFDRDRTVISKHINSIYKEQELDEETTCAKNAQVQFEGKRKVSRTYKYYNLDVVISVGYRVKSKRGITFRKWANNVLKQYLLKGYVVDGNRVVVSKESFFELENNVREIKNEIAEIKEKTFIEPVKQRLFYDGQYFDAYDFICSLIFGANQSIVLIDPYFDETGLRFFKKRKNGVKLCVCISDKSKLEKSDIEVFEKQYGQLDVIKTNVFHDRYLIVDHSVCYSLGTSLNCVGKRVFSVNTITEKEIIDLIIKKLEK